MHSSDQYSSLQKKALAAIINTTDYVDALKSLAADIRTEVSSANSEADVVSSFENNLYFFLRSILNIKYSPKKETLVSTERHIAKGRIDSKIGGFIIEFKHPSKLEHETDQQKASEQIRDYLLGLYKNNLTNYLGFITDGEKGKFISLENGYYQDPTIFQPLNYQQIDRIIRNIILLDQIALTSENLVKSFCEPSGDSLVSHFVKALFNTLMYQSIPRTIMLFNEWKELFRLAHDDKSKQRPIQERSEALSEAIGEKLHNHDEEYMVLYSLQTAYAVIIKIIAYKVISTIKYQRSLIDFEKLAQSTNMALQIQMKELENGAIFRNIGIGNLLEGDFFAWYSDEQQWNDSIAEIIKEIFAQLVLYEDRALFGTKDQAQDLFKDLYLKIMPSKVRYSLGEFYTPNWLADNLVTEALNEIDNKDNWKGLDPCAGSGTFLTVMIQKVLIQTGHLSDMERLATILERVRGIDLNPLTVLTARINYFINIAPLVGNEDTFEIPVYLGDASYVPETIEIDDVVCLKYSIKTMKGPIEIIMPKSAVRDTKTFSRVMTSIEIDISYLDSSQITDRLLEITDPQDRNSQFIRHRIKELADTFIELEKSHWNGIWARIVTNFLTTACLERSDIVVGNPPWIDWKNLPEGYRERIKSICVDRHLFSGDRITGGINLNICALIANVSVQNWLKDGGVLGFLMPKPLIFQQSYEGFRNFWLDGGKRLYFQKFFDWTQAGDPFFPVQQEFLTYFAKSSYRNYAEGLEVIAFTLKPQRTLKQFGKNSTFAEVEDNFTIENAIAGQCNEDTTIFTYADSKYELEQFKLIAGQASYIGREGIEFYPQELYLMKLDPDLKNQNTANSVYLYNYQNDRSKYKIPKESYLLEREFLSPLVKGIYIERFHINPPEYLVPFPYSHENPRIPLALSELRKIAPRLASYFSRFKSIIQSQSEYYKRIIGKQEAEFYALARVGKYSFAPFHVVFRDNTKWQAAVISATDTFDGFDKAVFQNHAVSISETINGNFIGFEEAHYICAILNTPITAKYILGSSDSRSFKIRPPIKIPLFDANNPLHLLLADLSIKAHNNYSDKAVIQEIDLQLDELYLKLVSSGRNGVPKQIPIF